MRWNPNRVTPPTSPNQCSYQVSTLRFQLYSTDNIFTAAHQPAQRDTRGENNTCKAFKGCGVKLIA